MPCQTPWPEKAAKEDGYQSWRARTEGRGFESCISRVFWPEYGSMVGCGLKQEVLVNEQPGAFLGPRENGLR